MKLDGVNIAREPMTQSRLPLIFLGLTSGLIALVSFRFLLLGVEQSYPDMPDQIRNQLTAFVLHISAAPIALAFGAVQFFPKLRKRWPVLHRWIGRGYGMAILVAGLSGIVIALNAAGGPVASAGFALLSVLWIAFTANAIRLAMAGRIADHRKWMIRSFALTFAAVTLRLYIPGFLLGGMDYTAASPYLAWICWVPNLIFAEWWLRR